MLRCFCSVALAALLPGLPCCVGSAGPAIQLIDGARFEVRVADPANQDWSARFPVQVAGAAADAPAILGEYQFRAGTLSFTPRFPLVPGIGYQASFAGATQLFVIPAANAGPRVQVEAVYPSRDVLPANILRFYLQFTDQMSKGRAYDFICITDETGKALELPFLEIAEELWDASGTRLTLLIDPGRIKNELRPRLEEGPVFHADRSYALKIDAAWPDAHGRPLAAPFAKRFKTTALDSTQPNPNTWRLNEPRLGSSEALRIEFPAPLDHGLLSHMIQVVDADRHPVEGQIEILADETQWRFRPTTAWRKGHHLLIDADLEDIVGNSIRLPFEVDNFARVGRRVVKQFVRHPIRLATR